jgi:hypothetical protein
MKEGPGLMRLTVLNTPHSPSAATLSPFSKYLIGACIEFTPARIVSANQRFSAQNPLYWRYLQQNGSSLGSTGKSGLKESDILGTVVIIRRREYP